MNTQWDKIIIGIDPGTNVMGYGLLGIKGKQPNLIVMGPSACSCSRMIRT